MGSHFITMILPKEDIIIRLLGAYSALWIELFVQFGLIADRVLVIFTEFVQRCVSRRLIGANEGLNVVQNRLALNSCIYSLFIFQLLVN